MFYLREAEDAKNMKDASLKLSDFSYRFFNYSYLTCKAFVDCQVDEKFTKSRFIDDILLSVLHNDTLVYICNSRKMTLDKAYKYTESMMFYVTQIFLPDVFVNEEIEIFDKVFEFIGKNKFLTNEIRNQIIESVGIEDYKLHSIFEIIHESKYKDCDINKKISNYYTVLVKERILRDEKRKHKSNDYYYGIAIDLVKSDHQTFEHLIKNIIQHIYESDNIIIDTLENNYHFLRLDNYIKSKVK